MQWWTDIDIYLLLRHTPKGHKSTEPKLKSLQSQPTDQGDCLTVCIKPDTNPITGWWRIMMAYCDGRYFVITALTMMQTHRYRNTALQYVALYCTTLCCILQHYTLLHSTAQYFYVQHCNVVHLTSYTALLFNTLNYAN